MTQDNNTPLKIVMGMHKDNHPSEQPQGTLRFALNTIKEGFDGNFNDYQSEPSNILCVQLDPGYKVIGSIYLNDGEKIIFATNNTISKILLLDSYCNVTELVSNDCLSFSTEYNILGEYRVRKGCNRTIYWSDSFNPDKWLDLDELDSFKDDDGNWDCNLMKLNSDFIIPTVTVESVNNTGGTLESGSYSFGIELLDNNFNVVDYGLFTNFIPVYDDSSTDTYQNIYGSLSSSFTSDLGGVDNTNKSITVNLNNLDTRFNYVRLIVIAKNTSNGFNESAYIVNTYLPITSDLLTYTLTDLNNVIQEDVNKFRVPKIKYNSSKVIEQVQNRLVRANLQEKQRDYSAYQRTANNITVQWVRKREKPYDISLSNNAKNPLSYQNGDTYIGDEIYALGIVYIYSDGTLSPVFHIPGREANSYDLTELTVGTDIPLADASHLELAIGQKVERWKYENTATGVLSGNLGYFQTDTTYPETIDCNGEYVYGDPSNGGLAGQYIRHHKIPCRSYRPTSFLNSSNEIETAKIGLQFDNITYPDTDIVGHIFVKAKRTESNKTVVDNGFIYGHLTGEDENNYYFGTSTPYVANTSINGKTVLAIHSPKIFSSELSGFDYIKFIGIINQSNFNIDDYYSDDGTTYNIAIQAYDKKYVNTIQQVSPKYRSLVSDKLISPNSIYNGVFDRPVINQSESNRLLAIEINSPADIIGTFIYPKIFVSLKRNIIPYRDLFSLQYEPITSILTLNDTQVSYSGNGFLNDFGYFELYFNEVADGFIGSQRFQNLFIDSDINYGLKVEGTDCNSIYQEGNDLIEYTARQILTFADATPTYPDDKRDSICRQYYRYNKDYLFSYGGASFIPLPFTYNFCTKCLEKKPNRIIFSPQSFDEEISDFFRINYTDDYIDLPAHRGEINGIKYKNNKLYVHTDQTTFILQPNPQFISTDQNTAYLNTGDFLSIPPYELMQSDLGYGGLQNKLAVSNSEGGYTWFDVKRGKILNLRNEIEEISRSGLSQWFKENSSLKLNEFVKEATGKNYAFLDSLSHNNGIGVSITYDPRFERVIISKKDYKVKEEKFGGIYPQNPEEGVLYLNSDNEFVSIDGGNIRTPTLENKSFFINSSWTISYSFKHKAFISFHSYLPDIMFSDELFYYTTLDNKIYKHLHKDSYSKFNGIQYPFIIEFVTNDYSTDSISSIQYYSTFENSGIKSLDNYSNLIVYNSNQSTGKLELVNINQQTNPYQNITLSQNQKSIITTDNNSKISNLWDYSIDNKVVTDNQEDLVSEFELNGYIDTIPVNIDFNKSSYEAGELKDKYVIIRLFYYPDLDTKRVSHRLSNTTELKSIR